MTTQLESQRQTLEWFNELQPSVKDMLCRTYDYILKHKDNPNKIVDFTELGVYWGCQSTSITTINAKFAKRFYDNLDHIKVLYDNRPSKKILYWTDIKEDINRGIFANTRFKYYTVFGYKKQTMMDRIEHERTDWRNSEISQWGGVNVHKFVNLKEIKK